MSDIAEDCRFDYQPKTRIIFGNNSINSLGEIANDLGGRRILLVSDPGVVAAGHVERAKKYLEAPDRMIFVFDSVRENPTTEDVDACLDIAQSGNVNLIVGLGGGSSMDTAKGCNFLLTNGGKMSDYWGVGKARKPMLPMIAIPTTAGTGSETQSFSLIADKQTHQKMACGDPKVAPKVALLDPLLTLTQPNLVSICTGLDAIGHALESAVTKRRNPISSLFSKEAFRLTQTSFEKVFRDPDDFPARSNMLLGASYAGVAIENSMLGAAHAAANPLTAHFDLVHGLAVGLMLPYVVEFNAKDDQAKRIYANLAATIALADMDEAPDVAVEHLVHHLRKIVNLTTSHIPLAKLNLQDADISNLAKEATLQWTANFNPRKIEATDFEVLYRSAFGLGEG